MQTIDKTSDVAHRKKNYSSPVLHVYGTIEKLTQAIASGSGSMDAATGSTKTAV